MCHLNCFCYVVVFFRYAIIYSMWQFRRWLIGLIVIILKLVLHRFLLLITDYKLIYVIHWFRSVEVFLNLLLRVFCVTLSVVTHVIAKVDIATWSLVVTLFGFNGLHHLIVNGHETSWWERIRLTASQIHFDMILFISWHLVTGTEAWAHAIAEIS